jgi:glycosyltransferase involved in cell wall biosynthesis
MRILVVNNLYPPIVYGGYEILCGQVVDQMRSHGHAVRVLTSAFEAARAPADPEVVRVLHLTTTFPRPGEDVGFVDFRLGSLARVGAANRQETLRQIDAFRPDLVFLWCLNRLGLGSLAAARERRVPVAWTINDEHPRQYRVAHPARGLREAARWAVERWLYPGATLGNQAPVPMAMISAHLVRRLDALGVPVGAARVVHQGIPLDRFPFEPRMRAAGEPLEIAFVGQLSRVKGVHTAVAGVGRAVRERGVDARLTVVGTGVPAYEAELRAQVEAEGLQGRVTFAGFVPHPEVPAVLHRHHVLVFPSEWDEPFGLAHLEAMACGTAVVSTTTGGSVELVRHGGNALAFTAGDPVELSFRLRDLDRDEALRLRLVRNARAWVREHHSLEGYVRHLEEFLEEVRDQGPAVRAVSGA